jgi:hypothetical protein
MAMEDGPEIIASQNIKVMRMERELLLRLLRKLTSKG